MTGIRLTPDTIGCPPTQTPPSDYTNPFREDSNGALWITQCFPDFRYFGEARHDVLSPVAPGSDSAKVMVGFDYNNGVAISAGTYTTRTITNTTPCTIGILLAHNVFADIQTKQTNWVVITLSERWNSTLHSRASVSSQHNLSGTWIVRKHVSSGANPHDVNAPNGGSTMQLAPGATAVVGCRLHLNYLWGAPAPGEMLWSMYSAVRIYGYVLG